MKTILITGGAGFIGSNLVRYLYNKYPNYKILVLDALTYSGSVYNFPEKSLDSERFEFWYGNVCNPEIVNNLVSKSDVVVHMAAESHVTRSIYDNRQFFETDVIGTQVVASAVLKYAGQIDRFIHISTSEVYGTALTEKMSEDHPLNPMSPYAAAKCGADRLVYSYWATYKIPAVIVRPFNNYGSHQHLEKVIPRFITSSLQNESMKVHGDGKASRDFVYAEDHCEALDKIIHIDREKIIGEIINIGTEKHISILDIVDALKTVMADENLTMKADFIGDRPGMVSRHTCDASKARELLGWEPGTDFIEGLKKTVKWYKNNEAWWKPQLWMRQIPIINAEGKKEMH